MADWITLQAAQHDYDAEPQALKDWIAGQAETSSICLWLPMKSGSPMNADMQPGRNSLMLARKATVSRACDSATKKKATRRLAPGCL